MESNTKGKGNGYRDKTLISMRPSEEWSAEPQTQERVLKVAKMITAGKSRETIQAFIKKNFKVEERQARAYYGAAMRYLLPDDEEEYRNTLIQANLSRLETIVEKCMSGKDYRDAIAAIKEMNNVIAPRNNVTIAKNKEGDEVISISFD